MCSKSGAISRVHKLPVVIHQPLQFFKSIMPGLCKPLSGFFPGRSMPPARMNQVHIGRGCAEFIRWNKEDCYMCEGIDIVHHMFKLPGSLPLESQELVYFNCCNLTTMRAIMFTILKVPDKL